MKAKHVKTNTACRLTRGVNVAGRTIPGGTEVVVTKAPDGSMDSEAVTVCLPVRYTIDDVQFKVGASALEPVASVGEVLGSRVMVMMQLVLATGVDGCGRRYWVGFDMYAGAYVYSESLGRYWVIGPSDLIDLAKQNGLDEVAPGLGAAEREASSEERH